MGGEIPPSFMTKEHVIGWMSKKLFGETYLIDLIDACSFGCKTCPVGVQPRRDGHKMTIDKFRDILDRAQSQGKIRRVQLYRWSDPLLHPDLHLFVDECRSRGIRCSTSSALKNWNCNLVDVIESRPDEFRISFSGWKNLSKYQVGNTIERFLSCFEQVVSLPRHSETTWVMYFHQYKDNIDETERARRMAEDNGLKFVAFPATFMVYDHIIEGYTEQDKETLALLTETPEENIARLQSKPNASDYCNMQEKEVTLNSRGEMQLCQLMYKEKYKVGDFMQVPLAEMREQIKSHSMCVKCKTKGVGKYSLIFADPYVSTDPVAEANQEKYATLTLEDVYVQ